MVKSRQMGTLKGTLKKKKSPKVHLKINMLHANFSGDLDKFKCNKYD